MENFTKIQDDEGDWYWIPNSLLDDFKRDLNKIAGKDYMDACDDFDYFIWAYQDYATCGDINVVPFYFKQK